ncbi:MAG: hypothetical protein ACYTXA_01865 [Nostoc sp.]
MIYLILLNFPKAQSTAKQESDRSFSRTAHANKEKRSLFFN